MATRQNSDSGFISRISLVCLFSSLVFILPQIAFTQDSPLIEIRAEFPEELLVEGFHLDSNQDVKIDVTGFYLNRRYDEISLSQAWILNSESRDVVFKMNERELEKVDKGLGQFTGQISLPAGNYEVYYGTYPYYNYDDDWEHIEIHSIGGFFERVFDSIFDRRSSRDNRFKDVYDRLYFRVYAEGKTLNIDEIRKLQNQLKSNALIDFSALRDDRYEKTGLIVREPVNLRIYAIGEARLDGDYDTGWIIDAENRDKLWELTYRNSEAAGGGLKNRLSQEVITLKPGRYKVVFVTDDSHSFRRWNTMPPFDPSFWGLTIWLENPQDASKISRVDANEVENKNAVLEMSHVRDDDFYSKGFTVTRSAELTIYAIGEGQDGEMYDYGWIIDAKTHKKIWHMDFYDTEHAGGSLKNRVFDEKVKFEPGNYIAYYVSDGSHSFNDWNASPPYDQELWGLSIYVSEADLKAGVVKEYQEDTDKSVLAQLIQIGDSEHKRIKFSLKKASKVHIYAMGEGQDGDMYDYAWLESAKTGRVVWEMTYRQTEQAGGARKNRLYDDIIYLEAGDYYLFYESDDSHSFEEWNDSPPYDLAHYGVTVYTTNE